ncbi:MAG: SURF1 family protein [Pseudolabrys sp.]|nr:SURF1 family protein [Pseudolabrys sp.]
MSLHRQRNRGGMIGAALLALCGIAVLSGLGFWQLDRKAWKENLIASLTVRLSRTPEPLPPREMWPRLRREDAEYRRVTFRAEFVPNEFALVYTAGSAFRPDVEGSGFWVMTPARLADGDIVIVNRGFVPFERKAAATAASAGMLDIVGVLRWPEEEGLFTPAAEPRNNVWYARDSTSIAASKQWKTNAPFYVEMEAPVPAGGLPRPGRLVVNLPDNHLQYALTWFGLAAGLGGVYIAWLARSLRRRA